MQAPLSALRVLDFGHVLAGPYCARLLADLGADVVKVESRARPDSVGATKAASRGGRQDRTPTFLALNRSKRSITINLKTPAGRDLAERLASAADVLVENFSAGVMGRLGLDYERLSQTNPGLVYVSMSGYGHSGPRRDWTSMNMNLQAYSGLMLATGAEDDPPTSIANSWNDFIGGLHACFAAVEALTARERGGRGAHIDLSQFECGVGTLGPLLLAGTLNRRVPPRLGNRSPVAAPQGCYPCRREDNAAAADGTGSGPTDCSTATPDAWCALSVQDEAQWQALVTVLGGPAWALDARYATQLGRHRHHDDLDAHLAPWFRTRSAETVERQLQEAGVPAARVRSIADTVQGPDRSGVFQPLEDPPGWSQLVASLPVAFARNPVAPPRPAPRLGEQTADVLREWLALPADELIALQESGALT